MLDALGVPDSHDWRDQHRRLPVARIIGGCSAHNFCALALGAEADYDAWNLPGWSWSELEPHVARVLEALPVCPMGEGGTTEPDGRLRGVDNLCLADASILPEIPPAPTNLTVLAAAEKISLGIRARLNR